MADNDTSTLTPAAEVEGLTSDERSEWLKTGELPSEKPVPVAEEKPEPKAEEPEEEVVESKFNVKPAKAASPTQMGYRQLRDEVKRLKEENERLAALREEPVEQPIPTKEVQAKAEPEKVRAKPAPQDVDDKGKPKYKTYEDYVEDLADWKAEVRLTDFQKQQAENAAKSQVEAAQRRVSEGWSKQVEAARKNHADFDQVALAKDLNIPAGSAVEQWILRSDQGTELLYHLAKNPDKLNAIHAMHPVDAARELVLVEAELAEPEEAKPTTKRVSSAPPPAREVGSRQAISYDPVDEALAEGDFERYRQAANQKELKSKRR